MIPDGHLDRLAAMVERGQRVLLVERADPRLAVRLRAAHCDVTALGVERHYEDRFTPFCARVICDEADDATERVDAAVAVATRGASYDGYLGGLVDLIVPAAMVAATRPGDLLPNAVRQNVLLEVERLSRRDVEFAMRIADRRLRVVGGLYDLANGRVELVS